MNSLHPATTSLISPQEPAGEAAASMLAAAFSRYGSFEQVRVQSVTRAPVGADEVQVRVRAAALHAGDCFLVRGSPFPMRLATGLLRPRKGIPGFDLAGEVEAVGSNVTQFRPGDLVFGASMGTCAQWVNVAAKSLAPMPQGLSFTQAAALPTSGLAALHALRDVARVQPGQRVLINGAAGGVGTFAVQIAKHFGAHVTGVCSGANVALVRQLGADEIIDYTCDDFTRSGQSYDVIFDNVENRSLTEVRRALTPTGTLVLNSGTGATGLALLVRLLKPLMLSPFTRQQLRRYLSTPRTPDLQILKDMVEAGNVQPVVSRTYALTGTADALRHIASGHAQGKLVVEL